MHSIEYDGAGPALWKVTTDDGVEWHAASEIEAAVELAEFITQRAQLPIAIVNDPNCRRESQLHRAPSDH